MAAWLKLDTGILKDEKIDVVRAMPEGDTLFVLWIGLLCLAMQRESSRLYISDGVPYSPDALSRILKIDRTVVNLGIETFEKFDMLHVEDDAIVITHLEERQAIDLQRKARERSRITSQKYREKQKKLRDMSRDTEVTHTEIEIEKEKDKNMSSKLDVEAPKPPKKLQKPNMPTAMRERIVAYLNEVCETNYKTTTKSTINHLNARYREGWTDFEDYRLVIDEKKTHWFADDKMFRYLRPETLFGTKFEAYRNEVIT